MELSSNSSERKKVIWDQERKKIRWEHYPSMVSSSLFNFFQDEKFTDVTLACDKQVIKCHRLVLSSGSFYFEEELVKNQDSYPIVVLSGITFPALLKILQLLYKGEVVIEQSEMEEFLNVAENLKVKGIFHQTEQPNFLIQPQASSSKTNKKGKNYTEEELMAALKDVQNGMAGTIAAKAYGIPSSTIYDNLREKGTYKRQPKGWYNCKNRKYTEQDMAAAIQDVRNGMTGRNAARARNIPINTIYAYLRKLGISVAQNSRRWGNKAATCTAVAESSKPITQPDMVVVQPRP